jgi:hypothetical protein
MPLMSNTKISKVHARGIDSPSLALGPAPSEVYESKEKRYVL